MRQTTSFGVFFVLVAMAAALPARAAAPPVPATQPAADRETMIAAVLRLSDPDYAKREEAMQTLLRAGPAAKEALDAAAGLPDPEISARAKVLLEDLTWRIPGDLPGPVVELMRTYRHSEGDARHAVVIDLAKMSIPGLLADAHLATIELEKDPKASIVNFHEAAGEASREVWRAAAKVPAAGTTLPPSMTTPERIEELLRFGLIARPQDRPQLSNISAWAVISGRVDQVAAMLLKQAVVPQPQIADSARNALVLVRILQNEQGNLDAALVMARARGDLEQVDALLIQGEDWDGLAARRKFPTPLFGAMILQRADRKRELEQTIKELTDPAAARGIPPEVRAQTLLALGRAEEGLAATAQISDIQFRFYLAGAQGKYDEQAAILDNQAQPGAQNRGAAVERSRLDYLQGNTKAAAARLAPLWAAALRNIANVKSPPAAPRPADVRNGAPLNDLEFLMAAVSARAGREGRPQALSAAQAVLQASADSPALTTIIFPSMLTALYRARATDAAVLAKLYKEVNKLPGEVDALPEIERLFSAGPKPGELDELLKQAKEDKLGVIGLTALARIMRAEGAAAAVPELLAKALADDPNPGAGAVPAIIAGKELMRLRDWGAAAAAFESTAQGADSNANALVLTLGSVCLAKAGKADAARQWHDRAERALLGDGEQRLALAEILQGFGFEAEAKAQLLIAARLDDGTEGITGMAQQMLSAMASEHGDFVEAQRRMEQALMLRARFEQGQRSDLGFNLIHQMHEMAALANISQGHAADAMKEIEFCAKLFPHEIRLALAAVPHLKKTKLAAEAAQVTQRAVAAGEELCRKYPDSAMLHNNQAWLLVRLRVDLDKAMEYAEKAHQLDPDDLAAADTLAEVCFQKGDKKRAIELIMLCIRREPDEPRHWLVKERFEKQGPDTEPPPER